MERLFLQRAAMIFCNDSGVLMCPLIPCVQSLLLAKNFSVLLPVLRELGELVRSACDGWKSCCESCVQRQRPKKHAHAWTSGRSVVWCLDATCPTEIEGLRVLD